MDVSDITGAFYNQLGQMIIRGGKTCLKPGSPRFLEAQEIAAENGITITPYTPPTQAEIDAAQEAEIQRLADDMTTSTDNTSLKFQIVSEGMFKIVKALFLGLNDPALNAELQAAFPGVSNAATWRDYQVAQFQAKKSA